jgi:alpha-tubulin suppressor-like RCC1 family protein
MLLCTTSCGETTKPALDTSPVIAPSATTVSFGSVGTSTTERSVQITNGGAGTLTGLAVSAVVYESGSGWLTARLNGTSAPATLTLTVNSTGLGVGDYVAQVRLSATGAATLQLRVSVTVSSTGGPGALFLSVSAGWQHTCAITTGFKAACWGWNLNGELGDGTHTMRPAPTLVSTNESFKAVSAGNSFTCAISTSGAAYCWGDNAHGQLGTGSLAYRDTPTLVAGGFQFSKLATGERHTCGVTGTGALLCWGDNTYGQLGDGTHTRRMVPTLVAGSSGPFTDVSIGLRTSCARTAGNELYCWGENKGQLQSSALELLVPSRMALPFPIREMSAGDGHTCAITSTNTMYCWGECSAGQLGVGSTFLLDCRIPVRLEDAGTPRLFGHVAAGLWRTCAVSPGGEPFCWGQGNLGNASITSSQVPIPVSGGTRFEGLTSTTGSHVCGITSGKTVYCWGTNARGQLGDGTTTNRAVPTIVFGSSAPTTTPAIALSATSIAFSGVAGGAAPASQIVQVTNAANGTLNGLSVGTITYQGASGWLVAVFFSSTAPTFVTLVSTVTFTAVGTHTATVPIISTASGVTNSPQNITVTLTVSASSLSFDDVIAGRASPQVRTTAAAPVRSDSSATARR